MPTPIITDGTMDKMIKAPRVVLPQGAGLFGERAARFDSVATPGDSGAYMRFLAQVCRGQCKAFDARTADHISERAIANSREHGMPPLSAHVFPRNATWHRDLQDIMVEVGNRKDIANPMLTAVIRQLESMVASSPTDLESIADRLIAGTSTADDGPMVPFVGAALQVFFTRMASTLSPEDVGACDVATVCPCCGMRPTVSIVRIDPERLNYRYLSCSLCMTEWNMERVKCTSCEGEKGVGYLTIDAEDRAPADAPVRAEICDECHTYLKILVQEKDPAMDALADDLNSLALDVLVDEKGYARTGPNLLFYPGQE